MFHWFVFSSCLFFTETTFKSTNFTEGNNLDLTCSLTPGSFSNVTLSKVKKDTVEVMAVFMSNGSTDVRTDHANNVNVIIEELEVTMLTLTLIKADCDDKGVYRCSHDNGQMSEDVAKIVSMLILYYYVYLYQLFISVLCYIQLKKL